VAIDYRLVMVPVAITIVIFLNDYSVPIPVFVAITNDCAISIAVTVMASADCYADRPDTNSNLFRARRHGNTNARNGCNYQSVFHHDLLTSEAKWSTFEQLIGSD
jgi:hypothetical protein